MKKQIITLSIAFIFWMIAIHPDDMKIRIQGSSSTNALKTLMDAYEYFGYVTFIVSEENIADIYKSIRTSYGTWDNVQLQELDKQANKEIEKEIEFENKRRNKK